MDLSILQSKIRFLISRRYKMSLFLTIIEMARHIETTNQELKEIYDISNEFKLKINANMTRVVYDNIWMRIEALRLNFGGYYAKLFFHYKQFPLIDNFKMWKAFLHSCFLTTSYKPSAIHNLTPVFNIKHFQVDEKLNAHINIHWRGSCLEGYFHTDTLHMLSYCPLTIDRSSYLFTNMINEHKFWFRGDIHPYFVSSCSLIQMKESYCKLFTLYSEFVNKSISRTAIDFNECSLYEKYFLIYMFSQGDDKKIFVSMLLYTIICKDSEVNANIVFKKLPYSTRTILVNRLNLTEEKLSQIRTDYDETSYEVKICALNASDKIKKIAIEKLREIQSKPVDIVKPQIFLEKLLEIPFGVIKMEPAFKLLKIFLAKIQYFVRDITTHDDDEFKIYYPSSWVDIKRFFEVSNELNIFKHICPNRTNIIGVIRQLEKNLKVKSIKFKNNDFDYVIRKNKANINERYKELHAFVEYTDNDVRLKLSHSIRDMIEPHQYCSLLTEWENIQRQIKDTQSYVNNTLNSSLYGQKPAKRAIEQIICEWITGDIKGYSFGFCGPPGVGKTTLAKEGLSKCLIDDDGSQRPLEIIALGGSSHGSVLEGHGYTYASSSCGKIVNTLIRSHCMNPIIFFDELDKVSKTPQGQEIINILIHLTDPSQNKHFHDKYFDGVDIDLSRVLFVFSYNDESLVDPILLDRIHKIQFQAFSTKEKVKICYDYILPQLYKQIGISQSSIEIPEMLVEELIETYTIESGVRKIKQVLSSVLREVNILILNEQLHIPFKLDSSFVKSKLLKDYSPLRSKKIYNTPKEGTAVGLFALTKGGGGILHIEIRYSKGKNTIEMTGNLGNIMKESVKVALTAVFNILSKDVIHDNIFEDALHIHATEGSVPKDGPSAGVAISMAILSCILHVPLVNDIAFTGEIDLNGSVTAVGGIPDKLRGAYLAGIKTVFCPFENKQDVTVIDRSQHQWLNEMKIYYVSNIHDVDLIGMAFTKDISSKLTIMKRARSFTLS